MSNDHDKKGGGDANDDIAGFRDFLEGEPRKRGPGSNNAAKNSGFELLTFLELESKRLDKQIEVLGEKSASLKSCDSFEQINKAINQEIARKHAELIRLLYQKDSPMMKSIRDLFKPLSR